MFLSVMIFSILCVVSLFFFSLTSFRNPIYFIYSRNRDLPFADSLHSDLEAGGTRSRSSGQATGTQPMELPLTVHDGVWRWEQGWDSTRISVGDVTSQAAGLDVPSLNSLVGWLVRSFLPSFLFLLFLFSSS